MIDKYKDHVHFAHHLTDDRAMIYRKLQEFIKQGGGNEIEFGCFIIGDANKVKEVYFEWLNS